MHVETKTELSPGLLDFIRLWKDKPGKAQFFSPEPGKP